jgi:hypothetical protein
MDDFAFPIYVHEKDDDSVMEFSTRAAIKQHLEAIDVENGEYEAWDENGRRLELSVGKPRSEWLKITPTEGQASEKEFGAIRSRAEKWKEYEPLWKRFRGWLARSQ